MSAHPKLLSKRRGVSLLEVLIAIATSVIIAGVLSAVFVNSWRAQIAQEAYTELQQKGRSAIDEISSTLKTSSGVETSVVSGSDTYTTSSSVLVFKTPALDGSNDIIAGTDYFIFRLNLSDNTKLERIIIADPSSIRANLASNTNLSDVMNTLTFTYYSSSGTTLTPGVDDITTTTSVLVDVSSQKDSNGRTITRDLDNLVYLRNIP